MAFCPDCKAEFPAFDGPVHAYLGGNAACWKTYGDILAREYGDPRYMKSHRWTVDAYAAQHPGKPDPRATSSVYIHLMALYLLIEKNKTSTEATEAMQMVTREQKDQMTWLPIPQNLGTITVIDVIQATTPDAHDSLVKQWAQSVWRAWSDHHDAILHFTNSIHSSEGQLS